LPAANGSGAAVQPAAGVPAGAQAPGTAPVTVASG
jgi:hypothetical protein